jgi:hypothetical protein
VVVVVVNRRSQGRGRQSTTREWRICRTFGSALGRTRTCDLLIRSWFARVWIRPNVSEDLAYLCRLRHFIATLFSPLFSSVLVRLQYGCSTLSLCAGGVVK